MPIKDQEKAAEHLKLFLEQEKDAKFKLPTLAINDTYSLEPMNIDWMYMYQHIIAFNVFRQIVVDNSIKEFLDIGSQLQTMFMFAQFAKCVYTECRPPQHQPASESNLLIVKAKAQSLPFPSKSFKLVTSFHAIEHFGLGRYGDEIDYSGDVKGVKEISRVLCNKGIFLSGVPVSGKGKARIEFNGQRVYDKQSFDRILNECDLSVVQHTFISPVGSVIISQDEQRLNDLTMNQHGVYVVMSVKNEH